jgi:hypothetical protein
VAAKRGSSGRGRGWRACRQQGAGRCPPTSSCLGTLAPDSSAISTTTMDVVEPVPQTAVAAAASQSNPLLSLLAAIVRAAFYLLNKCRQLVAFCTLTLPLIFVNVLSWSWTFQVRAPLLRNSPPRCLDNKPGLPLAGTPKGP